MSSPLAYRDATPHDLRLVIDSWVSSYRTAHAAGMIAMEDWRGVMCPQVAKVLTRPGARTLVAFMPGEAPPADVYGWLCFERDYELSASVRDGARWGRRMVAGRCPLVHYVYVLEGYRGRGVGRGLLRQAGIEPDAEFLYSCKTGFVSKLMDKIPNAKWNPLIVRFPTKKKTDAKEHQTQP